MRRTICRIWMEGAPLNLAHCQKNKPRDVVASRVWAKLFSVVQRKSTDHMAFG